MSSPEFLGHVIVGHLVDQIWSEEKTTHETGRLASPQQLGLQAVSFSPLWQRCVSPVNV